MLCRSFLGQSILCANITRSSDSDNSGTNDIGRAAASGLHQMALLSGSSELGRRHGGKLPPVVCLAQSVV